MNKHTKPFWILTAGVALTLVTASPALSQERSGRITGADPANGTISINGTPYRIPDSAVVTDAGGSGSLRTPSSVTSDSRVRYETRIASDGKREISRIIVVEEPQWSL